MTDFVNHFLQYMQFYENNSSLCQEHLKILIGGGEGKDKKEEEGKVDKPNIYIYGARNKEDISNISDQGWAIVKANKIEEILKKKEEEILKKEENKNFDERFAVKAVFYDDTLINVEEMEKKKLKNIMKAKHINEKPQYIEDDKTSIWNDIEECKYNTIFFDFDLTLSDIHSGGIHLENMLENNKDKDKDKQYKFMHNIKRYNDLKENLLELANKKNTEIYIISRGLAEPLKTAFEELGFQVELDYIHGKTIFIKNINNYEKTISVLEKTNNIENIRRCIIFSANEKKMYEFKRDPKTFKFTKMYADPIPYIDLKE